jgi:hypothetical protein
MPAKPQYATATEVPVEKTRAEIERTLARYGADAFGYMTEAGSARLAFRMGGRHIRFHLPLPRASDYEFAVQGFRGQQRRPPEQIAKAWEQACRSRWRALLLILRAKLEAVAAGITTIEDEFLAHTVLPDGSTVGEWVKPQLAVAYSDGAMPTGLMIEGPRHEARP